jgi:hypothetical protein
MLPIGDGCTRLAVKFYLVLFSSSSSSGLHVSMGTFNMPILAPKSAMVIWAWLPDFAVACVYALKRGLSYRS